MVEQNSAPVRRLLFTRAPAAPQPSPKTPFDTIPERHGKDVNSTSVSHSIKLFHVHYHIFERLMVTLLNQALSSK